MFDSQEATFALAAVRQAASLARQVQQDLVTSALTKGDRSPVTVADFAAQGLVSRLLLDAFPDDPLVGEEDAADLRQAAQHETLDQVSRFVGRFVSDASPDAVCQWIDRGRAEPGGRFWTLDPVDGTKGFLRGEQYAVALALIVDGQVQLGALGCPNLTADGQSAIGGPGSVAIAVRGQGAWACPLEGGEWQRLQVSDRTDPSQARLLRSVESGHTNTGQMGELVTALGAQAEPVLMDSQAKYQVLAAGRGDLLFRLLSPAQPDYRERIWDQAAGSLLVQEAGGRVTDLEGRPLDFTQGRTLAGNRGVVASNGRLHEVALETLRRVAGSG